MRHLPYIRKETVLSVPPCYMDFSPTPYMVYCL